MKEWPEDGPNIAWQIETAGVGYSSVAATDGRVFTQGDLDGFEHIMALSEKDGSVLWAVQPKAAAEAAKQRVETQFTRFDKNGDGILDPLEAVEGLGRSASSADSVTEGDKTEIAQKRADISSKDSNTSRMAKY